MAVTPSTMLALPQPRRISGCRTRMTNGFAVRLQSCPALLVMFICNHCPNVKHVRTELPGSQGLPGPRCGRRGHQFQRRRALPRRPSREHGHGSPRRRLHLPYLYDETQAVAKAYGRLARRTSSCSTRPAACLRGHWMTAARATTGPVTGADLRAARTPSSPADRSPQIKNQRRLQHQVKPGNEPEYQ